MISAVLRVVALCLLGLPAQISAQAVGVDSVPGPHQGNPLTVGGVAAVVAATGAGVILGFKIGEEVFPHGTGDDPGLEAGIVGGIILGTVSAAIGSRFAAGQRHNGVWGAAAVGIIPGVVAGIAAAAISDGSIPAVVVGYSLGQGVSTPFIASILR